MNNDLLFKQIQELTNRVPLIIIGSGASIPFGLPSMLKLGKHLQTSISFTDSDDRKQFEEFDRKFSYCGDLERTLNEIQLRPNVLNAIVSETWNCVNRADLVAYDSLLSPSTSYPLADLFSHLLQTSGRKLSVLTTNYDRLAEYAAGIAQAFICNGFAANIFGHFSDMIHQTNYSTIRGFAGQVNIWKVHGSLDWFKNETDASVQLPLRQSIPHGYRPSIVTPGVSKYYETHGEPYRTIFTQADREIDDANGYFCIGYGFNDDHVQPKLISQIKAGKPIVVITKQLTEKAKSSIIDNGCKNYLLIEQDSSNNADTKIYSSKLGESILSNSDYWSLQSYLTIIKS